MSNVDATRGSLNITYPFDIWIGDASLQQLSYTLKKGIIGSWKIIIAQH